LNVYDNNDKKTPFSNQISNACKKIGKIIEDNPSVKIILIGISQGGLIA